jgi:MarR family transcriptional regulator, transcriptional regulator for hemolysin
MGHEADLRRSASLKLAMISRQLRVHFDCSVARLGVTRSQWTAIAAIARNPGASQRIIASMLEMSEASAGRLIDRLCADGLATRSARADDRRANSVCLTEAGESLASRLGEIACENEAAAFSGLRSDDLCRLISSLDTITANVFKSRPNGSLIGQASVPHEPPD